MSLIKKFYHGLAIIFFGLFATAVSAAQIANYIGTDQTNISLTLSKNGANWNSYTINYQGIGNVPSSSDPSKQWSSWDVKDTEGNYYGTITLNSDGNTVTYINYVAGNNGYYLDGVNLSYNSSISAYQLAVNAIHGGSSGQGPFPNAAIATPMVYPNSSTPVILSVKGNQIVNNKGIPITLKGLVRPSLEWNNQGQYLSEQDIDNMAKWGINAIRLDLNQNYWLQSGPISEKGSYKQIINAIVYYATQHDIAVILDLHWTHNGEQSPMADSASLTFWQQVATDYKNFGTVIFELFNEPFGISQNTWLSGDGVNYVGYQQLYNAVRNTGAKNICIINGLDYGYDLSFVNQNFGVKGSNIVYGSHPYNEKGSVGYTGPGGSLDNDFAGIINNYPVIFTEFGVNQSSYFPDSYAAVYTRILNYATIHHISYTGFAWWVDQSNPNTFPDLISDWSGTPINGGKQVFDDIQNVPPTKLDSE